MSRTVAESAALVVTDAICKARDNGRRLSPATMGAIEHGRLLATYVLVEGEDCCVAGYRVRR